MARRLFSERIAATLRTRICLAAGELDRDQRLLLFAPAADELSRVVRRDAGRLRLRGERRALHHASQAAEGCAHAAGEFLCLGRARACAKSSDRSSGSCRRTSATIPIGSRRSSICSRATRAAAAKLARKHDAQAQRSSGHRGGSQPSAAARAGGPASVLRDAEFVQLLREHDIALVVADTAGKWPFMEDVTSDFIYVRLARRRGTLCQRLYRQRALKEWARKIRLWAKGAIPARHQAHRPAHAGGEKWTRCLRLLRQ